jgi:predicted Zn-dependent protease
MSGRHHYRWPVLAALALLACSAIQKVNPLADKELTIESERELTAGVARQIREQVPLVRDPILLAYLNELGQEIVATTEPQPFIYRFVLIRDDALNAFTIGGGHVYLHDGVLASAGNVSELVGVLAHEVAHVRRRHIAKRNEGQGVSTLITLATLAAAVMAGGDPSLIMLGAGINVALQLQNSRSAEAEADREAIAYMVRAGYDPDGLRRFFQRLLATYPSDVDIPAYLYSHPAVKERMAAVRVEMERTHAPRDLRRNDPRLAAMQARLAQILEPVAGGSGLYARPEFDRSRSDPLIEEARRERSLERDAAALALLTRAEQLEPNDPRVPLLRADWAEEREDWEQARLQLERAFDLDPHASLVQYRLGAAYARLGQRTRAAFYLEQAAAGFRPGSEGRTRAELELQRLAASVLDEGGLHGRNAGPEQDRFRAGEPVEWWGQLSRSFVELNPEVTVRWIGPGPRVAFQETIRMSPLGRLTSELPGDRARPGTWVVEVSAGDTAVDRRTFQVVARDGSPD